MSLTDQLAESFTPHIESTQKVIGCFMYEILQELRAIRLANRPQIHDRWGIRPFAATTAPIAVAETKQNEILKLQTVFIQFRHELEKEPLPAFIIQVNGQPVYALSPGRILEPKEWGFQSETFGGDLVVPRGSLLEVTPALTGKFECRGAFTFIRNLLPSPYPNSGYGTSGEDLNLYSHAGEHEIARDMAAMDLPHTGESRPAGEEPIYGPLGLPVTEQQFGPYEESDYTAGLGGKRHG